MAFISSWVLLIAAFIYSWPTLSLALICLAGIHPFLVGSYGHWASVPGTHVTYQIL
jgi:hypothetical protein